MGALIERAAAAAERSAQERVRQIANEWREALPDARVTETAEAVVVEAPGLNRRWLAEPMLRFAGSLTR